MTVGIIGLGYVGLPLAVAFAEAGNEVVGVDVDSRTVESLRAGHSEIEDVADARLTDAAALMRFTTDPSELAELRRGPDLRADAAGQPARARPQLHLRRRALAGRRSAPRPARSARVDHLSRHDPRAPAADPRGVGLGRGTRLQPRLLSRADRPGAQRPFPAHDAEGRRWPDRRLPRARGRGLLGDLRRGRRRSPLPRRQR